MHTDSFKQWLQKKEAYLPPPAVPPAMVEKKPTLAQKNQNILAGKFKAPKPVTGAFYDKYAKNYTDLMDRLDKLATATNQNPAIWTKLHSIQPNVAGLTHQEALEEFIKDFSRVNKPIIDDLEKHGKEYDRLLDSGEQYDALTSRKLLAYMELIRIVRTLSMQIGPLDRFQGPESADRMAQILNSLDQEIFKSPVGYQKALDRLAIIQK